MRVWQLAQDALRLCCSSLAFNDKPPNSLSSAGSDPASPERARALHQFRPLSGLDLFLDPVKLGQVFIQKSVVGEQDFTDRPLLANHVLEERDRLVVHGLFHVVRELGKATRIHALMLVEMVKAQPLAEEFSREPPRLRIGDHSLHLPPNPLWIG